MDDSTSNEFHYTQYFQDDSEEYLITLNTLTYTVDKYSLNSGEMVKRINIPMGGPEGITGNVLQGLTYSSPDSIFVFVRGNINGSICIDEDGNEKRIPVIIYLFILLLLKLFKIFHCLKFI